MIWIINDTDEFESASDVVDWLVTDSVYEEAIDEFDEFLDENYGGIQLAGDTYWTSYLLANADHDRYLSLLKEWRERKKEDDRANLYYQLMHMENGESIRFHYWNIKLCNDEINEEEDRLLDEILDKIDKEFAS